MSVEVFLFGFGTVNLCLFHFPIHCVLLRAFNLVAQMYIHQSKENDVKEVVDVVWFQNICEAEHCHIDDTAHLRAIPGF